MRSLFAEESLFIVIVLRFKPSRYFLAYGCGDCEVVLHSLVGLANQYFFVSLGE